MRIGIATFHWSQNYGALLQTYALKTKLERMGHQVCIIDKIPCSKNKVESFSSKVKDSVLNISHPFDHSRANVQRQKLKSFRNRYFTLVKENDITELDAIVCGSDQIWNSKLTGGELDPLYFGISDFFVAKKKIAYAASIGESNIPEKDVKMFRTLVSGMDAISVREKAIVEEIQQYAKHTVYNVVDPTLLLKKDDYISLIDDRRLPGKPYVLIYQNTYDENLYNIALYIAKEKNLEVIEVARKRYRPIQKCNVILDGGIDTFLKMYKDADYIVTNTFHGTVFAIEFGKPFVSIPLKGRESRVVNLSKITALESRLVSYFSEQTLNKIITQEIDFDKVYCRLDMQRHFSEKFLLDALDW